MNATNQHRLSNWACGALTALSGLLLSGSILGVYRWVSAHVPFSWPAGALSSVGAFVLLDALYYLQHRAEHRFRLLWATHAVHHQSPLCDASVSFRTSMLAPVLVLVPHWLLAMLGVPLEVYLPVYALHTAFVFLLHSRTPRWFDRAGWMFNSPYLHRGHHSTAPHLRGKNLGGALVIWDRLFGTYEPRCDVDTFGTGRGAAPLNPLEANLQPLREWLSSSRGHRR
ncbi:MAG: sterol desaturase family protein [Archangium sp.]|nr:sterol desaturase family protein [Archangium sp.]